MVISSAAVEPCALVAVQFTVIINVVPLGGYVTPPLPPAKVHSTFSPAPSVPVAS